MVTMVQKKQKITGCYFIKLLFVTSVVVMLAITSVNAAPLKINFEGAFSVWNHDPKGIIQYEGDEISINDDLSLGNRNDYSLWFKFDHPAPIIPCLKVEYTPIQIEDESSSLQSVKFANEDIQNVYSSKLEFDTFDINLYFHLPIIKLISLKALDITYGLNLRFLNGQALISGLNTSNVLTEAVHSFSSPMPMIQFGVSLTPIDAISLITDFRATNYSGHHWYDVVTKLHLSAPGIKYVFLGVGYRYQDIKLDGFKDITADQTMQGWFGEVGFRF